MSMPGNSLKLAVISGVSPFAFRAVNRRSVAQQGIGRLTVTDQRRIVERCASVGVATVHIRTSRRKHVYHFGVVC